MQWGSCPYYEANRDATQSIVQSNLAWQQSHVSDRRERARNSKQQNINISGTQMDGGGAATPVAWTWRSGSGFYLNLSLVVSMCDVRSGCEAGDGVGGDVGELVPGRSYLHQPVLPGSHREGEESRRIIGRLLLLSCRLTSQLLLCH